MSTFYAKCVPAQAPLTLAIEPQGGSETHVLPHPQDVHLSPPLEAHQEPGR